MLPTLTPPTPPWRLCGAGNLGSRLGAGPSLGQGGKFKVTDTSAPQSRCRDFSRWGQRHRTETTHTLPCREIPCMGPKGALRGMGGERGVSPQEAGVITNSPGICLDHLPAGVHN